MNTTIFLCGDVMTGRGIDQILPHPSDPKIHESYVKNAKNYVELAEVLSGHISTPVKYEYPWGEAIPILEYIQPDAKIINLETSITTSNDWENKGINYRMHPENTPFLVSAKIDCCSLANNHILDWGNSGLEETLHTLHHNNIKTTGAGSNLKEAQTPVILEVSNHGRILIFSIGTPTSGIPPTWKASEYTPGINYLPDLSLNHIDTIAAQISTIKNPMDVVVLSIHWGPNWGYDIPQEYQIFARSLIDKAGVDIVYGHSSHHFKGIEYYKEKLILYGCGDFLNDYEGIAGFEAFRSNLVLMYFPTINFQNGKLVNLKIFPLKLKKFTLINLSNEELKWVHFTLNCEGNPLNARFDLHEDHKHKSFCLKTK